MMTRKLIQNPDWIVIVIIAAYWLRLLTRNRDGDSEINPKINDYLAPIIISIIALLLLIPVISKESTSPILMWIFSSLDAD
jgi:hypothetical protein